MAVALDVCDAQAWDEAVIATEKAYGRLDLMVNLSGSNVRVGFEEQTEAMWRSIIDVNLTACFIGIKSVVPAMRRAGRGAIGNLGGRVSSGKRAVGRDSRYALDDLRKAIVISEILSPPVSLRSHDDRRPS